MSLVAGIGELLWDEFPGGRELGGAPANFVWHARSLGLDAVVISRVGEDEDGRRILERLERLGLGAQLVGVDQRHPTGRSAVTLDTAGVPSFVVHTDAAWDFIEFTPAIARVADATDAIFFGTLGQRSPVSRKTTRAFLDRLPPGSIRLLDLNLRPPHYTREVIEAALESASVVKLNEIELDLIAPMLDLGVSEEARAQRLLDAYGLRLVAVTRGERGSTLFAGGRTVDHGGFGTRVVDTVGAGDAFAAALVAGMLKGLELDVINAHANRVASYICGRRGATPDLPADLADFRL